MAYSSVECHANLLQYGLHTDHYLKFTLDADTLERKSAETA